MVHGASKYDAFSVADPAAVLIGPAWGHRDHGVNEAHHHSFINSFIQQLHTILLELSHAAAHNNKFACHHQ